MKDPDSLARKDAEYFSRKEMDDTSKNVARANRYVQSLCGLYSRIARQFKVDRSYVSRVARGERHSEEIERALSAEFVRITGER